MKKTRAVLVAAAVSVGLIVIPSTAQGAAATVRVPCDPAALQSAIAMAGSGTTLDLASHCVYNFTAPDNGVNALPVVVTTLTIKGNDATIQRDPAAASNFRLFEVDASGQLTLKKVTVTGGSLSGGGFPSGCGGGIAVFHDGMLALKSSTVTGNTASVFGGGIFNFGGTVTLDKSTISNNTSAFDSGGLDLEDASDSWLKNSVVTGNTSGGSGGGIGVFGLTENLILKNTTVSGNTAAGGGGGLFIFGDNLDIQGGSIADNTARFGGGILNYGTLRLRKTKIQGNTAGGTDARGGGIYNVGTTTLEGGKVSGNQAVGAGAQGGGIFNFGTFNLSGKVTGNGPDECGTPSTVPGC